MKMMKKIFLFYKVEEIYLYYVIYCIGDKYSILTFLKANQ